MASLVKYGLVVLVLCSFTSLSSSESNDANTEASPKKPDRASRKYYDAEIYTGAGHEALPLDETQFDAVPRALVGKKYVIPYRHSGSGIMKKTGSNPHWNAWKGEDENSEEDDSGNEDGPKWQQPPPQHHQQWGNDATWAADPMSILLLKNAMSEYHKGESKPGFLEKITKEPALMLIAASIPISLLLAAVLPVFMNYMMTSTGIPTITTTATGSSASRSSDSSSHVDIMPYLGPLMEAVGTFGVRSIGNPDCMQRIFCQVAQEKVPFPSSKYVKKAASLARYLSGGSWLENLGVQEIVESLSTGNCETISCGHSSKKETVKSRYSEKANSNSVKK